MKTDWCVYEFNDRVSTLRVKKQCDQYIQYIDPLYLDYLDLVKGISNIKKNRYIIMGLPHVSCVSKLKYFVVFFSPFIIYNLQLTKTC